MFFTLFIITQAHTAISLELHIHGLNHTLQSTINNYFTINKININNSYDKHQIDNDIRKVLRTFGYYAPIIHVDDIQTINHTTTVVDVLPGKPIKIAGVNVILHGEAKKDNDYLQWIQNNKAILGSILNHDKYDKFKDGLFNLALRKGYFDAFFNKHKLYVVPALYQAYWYIDFNSGQRYHFGAIYFHGTNKHENYLRNLIKINIGTPYSTELLAESNHRLTMINWFNSVVISPNFNVSKINKTIPLDITVIPKKSNNIKIGIGYSTDIGPRVKFIWNKPWLYTTNNSLQTNINVFKTKQTIDLNYKIPTFKNPLEQYFLLKSELKREYNKDTQSYSTMLNISRYWNFSTGWQKIINLNWSIENFIKNHISNNTMLIHPSIEINRVRQLGGITPSWGDSQHYSIDISNVLYGSDINFIICQAQNMWIRSINNRHRLVIRSNLGWIQSKDYIHIPPSLLFFAGGDRSIRGYKYRSISPYNNDGKLIGATRLITGSVEYQYNFIKKWWSSIFIDSGEAVQSIKDKNFKTGIGVGMRWESLIGPIKLDIATPITNNKHNIQFYISLGPEL